MITLSIIKADTGGFVGHSAVHPQMVEAAEHAGEQAKTDLLVDAQVQCCGDDLPPVMIENDADGWGPDLVRVYYADPLAQANVTTMAIDRSSVTVDTNSEFPTIADSPFEVGDLVALIAPDRQVPNGGKLY